MNMKKWIALIGLFTLLSCSSYKSKINKEWDAERCFIPIDTNIIEGQYSNKSEKSNTLLWELLTGNFKDNQSSPDDIIEFRVVDKNHIIAILIDDNKIMLEQQIEYSIEEEHLLLEPMTEFLKPAFPIFWYYTKEQLLFCLTAENKLNILRHASGAIFVGPMPIFGGGGGSGLEYEYLKLGEKAGRSLTY